MTLKIECENQCLIGVVSDTHGYVADSALRAFAGADLIIHAGDIGEADVLHRLKKIAPLVAVRGNMDFGNWAYPLPQEETLQIGQVLIRVIHDVQRMQAQTKRASINAIVFGHSHRRLARETDGVLYLNPGSASYPKYGDSASVALLRLNGKKLEAEFINLGD